MGIPFYRPDHNNVLVSHRIDYSESEMIISTTHRAWRWKDRVFGNLNTLKYRGVLDSHREYLVKCYNGAFNRKGNA